MRRALAIEEKTNGLDHPDMAVRLNNLAALLVATNRLAEAEPMMRRAVARQQSLGPFHPQTVAAHNILAALEAALSRGGGRLPARLHLSRMLDFLRKK